MKSLIDCSQSPSERCCKDDLREMLESLDKVFVTLSCHPMELGFFFQNQNNCGPLCQGEGNFMNRSRLVMGIPITLCDAVIRVAMVVSTRLMLSAYIFWVYIRTRSL